MNCKGVGRTNAKIPRKYFSDEQHVFVVQNIVPESELLAEKFSPGGQEVDGNSRQDGDIYRGNLVFRLGSPGV